MRGNRCTKNSTSKIVAFDSVNFGPLGEVGVNFNIFWNRVLQHNFEGDLNVFTDMSEDISIINMSPCINLKVIEAIFFHSKAVVIQAYGMGNLPTNNKKLLSLIKSAIDNDVVVIIKT
jgi:L-asparaginase/Glu-tRNA(Gln) amidotransferase subunit D